MAKKAIRDLTVEEQLSRGPMDLPFLMLVVLLTGIGIIMMFSASYASAYYDVRNITGNSPVYYFIRQALFGGAGIAVMYLVSKISYQHFRWMSVLILGVAFALLILVLIPGIGVKVNGARRWIRSFGPIPQFQPSEVAKIGIILYFSARLAKRGTEKKKLYSKRTYKGTILSFLDRIGLLELLPYGAVLVLTAGLLMMESHLSATILVLLVGASILFAAGIHMGWFAAGVAIFIPTLIFVANNVEYMKDRISMWKNPWLDPQGDGFQAIQSLYAIGSGGLFGLGLGQSRQKFLYLPEPQNDFVFSIVCEELGYVGAAIVLILFALLILRGYWLAVHARDRFGSLVTVGITTQVAVQVFLNIAVVTNLIPVTGISLPFFSYGGTALLIQLAEMGIILSISRQILAPKSG